MEAVRRKTTIPLTGKARAEAGFDRLQRWLVQDAAPLWASVGLGPDGLFEELIGLDGRAVAAPRRARVQPRQLYALTASVGWGGSIDPESLRAAWARFEACYRRPDGLRRALVDADGQALDDRAALYDQAFVMFGLAALRPLLGARAAVEAEAVALRARIQSAFGRDGDGFWSMDATPRALLSNPHMHLLEACLAWMEIGGDGGWSQLAEAIVTLALSRFIDPLCGGVKEHFDDNWNAAPGEAGRLVEPGHQFEWAWLMLRWSRLSPTRPASLSARVAAVRMLRLGEEAGVDPERGVAINAIFDDLSVQDANARLWPQTERIKAWALVCADLDWECWDLVADAVEGLELYLRVQTPGLWADRMTASGEFVAEPAPASSFYHIVCAIDVLGAALGRQRLVPA